jgi:hypothetical protein
MAAAAPDPVEIPFHGETAYMVVSQMREAIAKLVEYIHEQGDDFECPAARH